MTVERNFVVARILGLCQCRTRSDDKRKAAVMVWVVT
jgi:hypothetical protein